MRLFNDALEHSHKYFSWEEPVHIPCFSNFSWRERVIELAIPQLIIIIIYSV